MPFNEMQTKSAFLMFCLNDFILAVLPESPNYSSFTECNPKNHGLKKKNSNNNMVQNGVKMFKEEKTT